MEPKTIRILVPLDGSPAAESILPTILPLSRSNPCELTLLQVVNSADESEVAQAYLARLRKDLLLDGVRAQSRVEWGYPAEEILHEAKKADLVAMTTHARSGLRRLFMGSVAEEVVRCSPTPILLNRPGTRIGDWKRIVVALDGFAAAESALAPAARLAETLDATLHLIQVHLPLLPYDDHYGVIRLPEPDVAYLERIATQLASQGRLAVPVARQGSPAREILRYSEEIGAGLICMASEQCAAGEGKALRSVTEAVIRSSPCPVLVTRAASVQETSLAPDSLEA